MLHAGLRLGERYRLEARIGAGGMGEVWRAVDDVLDRVVAVKVMLPEVAEQPDFARRFVVEAKAMASVNHPAVASIHDFGRDAGITFFVMEFIEGESLSQVLARGRLDAVTTMRLVAQAADGLQAVHERGIVHRDIKPANLMVRRNGSVVITDFGISRAWDATQLTASGAILGTPTYLSPEQVLGRPATGLSDVYSLGLAAYECLAGRRPFEGDNPYAVALQRLQVAPRTLAGDIPGPVLVVVERALATAPADRWPSAAALADAARAAASAGPALPSAADQQTTVRPSGSPRPAPPSTGTGPSGWPSPAWPGASPNPASPNPASPNPPSRDPASPNPARPGAEARESSGPVHPWPGIPSPVHPGTSSISRPQGSPGPAHPVPEDRERRTARRRWAVLAAILVAVLLGVTATWRALRPDDGPASAAGPTPSTTTLPAGFVACDTMLCPVEPLCWAGLVAIGGRADRPPRDVDCTQTHAWETFAATVLPPDVSRSQEDELLQREDMAQACSKARLASRSRDPEATRDWQVEAWPIAMKDSRLVHCIATGEAGGTRGSVFRSGG